MAKSKFMSALQAKKLSEESYDKIGPGRVKEELTEIAKSIKNRSLAGFQSLEYACPEKRFNLKDKIEAELVAQGYVVRIQEDQHYIFVNISWGQVEEKQNENNS